MLQARQEFVAGVMAELPVAVGVLPFGLIYGALALNAGLPADVAQAMSAVVFAGSSQFIGVQLMREAAPLWLIVLTTLVVNARHMLYSASVMPFIRHLSPGWKAGLAYLLTDEAYAITIVHYQRLKTLGQQHWYFLGAGLTLWLAWQASTWGGIALGARLPATWALDFTLALTFIGIVVPALKNRAELSAALVAGAVAVLAADWPLKTGLLAAATAGIVTGLALDTRHADATQP